MELQSVQNPARLLGMLVTLALAACGGGGGGNSSNGPVAGAPSPSPSPTSSYVGCYADNANRALPSLLINSGATSKTCIAAAAGASLAYAGLQYGGQCFAGNALTSSKLSDAECNMPCSALPSESCGGGYRNSVYATGVTPAPAPPPGASPSERQVKQSYVSLDGVQKVWYLEYLPLDYATSTKTYPLLVFFHGLGEGGNPDGSQLDKVKTHGPPKLIDANNDMCFTMPTGKECFIVVSPQNGRDWWDDRDTAGMLAHALKTYRVDPKRVYVTGLSMGGGATWNLAAGVQPGTSTYWGSKLAAVAPVCGASESTAVFNTGICKGIASTKLPVWAFHGDADPTVLPAWSQGWVDKINKVSTANGYACDVADSPPAQITYYAGVGHDSWSITYDPTHQIEPGKNLYQWLLSHQR